MGETLKIVLIDDEQDFCALLKDNLQEGGKFQVETCSLPEKALAVIQSQLPDLILIDEVMPLQKGHEVIQSIRKDPQVGKVPIIMISGRGEMVYDKRHDTFKWMPNTDLVRSRGDIPETKSAEKLADHYGVDDFIAKPFTTEILLQVIEAVLARRRKSSDTGAEPPPV